MDTVTRVDQLETELDCGSVWHRWEPHVHAPGTLLNNQFTGKDPWSEYFDVLEASYPPIRAIGATDYYLTDTYEHVRHAKENGRLPKIHLIFPNVELRLNIGTMKGRWVNVHLLVSPEHPEHLDQLRRFLTRLDFRAHGDTFACTREDLARLGRAADPNITDDTAALRYGAGQFKVSFDQLREEFDKSDWAKENILVAVAGGADGTSGVRETADITLRQEMERFAKIIFASSPAQRGFWLGQRNVAEEELRRRYGSLKPCLHGSDGHETSKVGAPDGDRFSWVKGGLEFDALRQACIDPAGRAFVGPNPPEAGTPSQRIGRIEITGASWAATPKVAFNPGLVAIIGARGSGKTALADMIALACDAIPEPSPVGDDERRPSSSFLVRACSLLGGAQVKVVWQAGEASVRALDGSAAPEVTYARARYLSQQFVEELCSASGATDALISEIERVIFESHPLAERGGALDFSELLELRASRFRQARDREEVALVHLSERIGTELEKHRYVRDFESQVLQKQKQIAAYSADRERLVAKGSEERVKRLTDLTAAAEKVRSYLRYFSITEQALLALHDEVADYRQNQAPELLRRSQQRHAASRMPADKWNVFLTDYIGNVDEVLTTHLRNAREWAAKWRGNTPNPPATPETSLIKDNAELEKLPLADLEAEMERLQQLVSVDLATQKQFAAMSARIASESTALVALKEKLTDAQGANERATALQQERGGTYRRVIQAIVAEQDVLTELYEPLMKRLDASSGTLRKLTFTVSRTADVGAWARIAEEELLDRRRQGPFKGKGSLQSIAEEILKDAWEKGDAECVSAAMSTFREKYQEDLVQHSIVPKANSVDYRTWLKRFAQWLFSTDHIKLHYGIDYDGVDIRKLSPGTRGIVLLLLYLALDDGDDRPLIIDQPEENLDPKSVFDELVDLFISAKSKRQVIMVTHNANLVINTDADQIIVAEAGHHERGQLPEIKYLSGDLENAQVRKAVCDILEGGEHAFRERARRLRVRLAK